MRLPRSVETADVEGKRVLVRADLNVPLDGGAVADDTRIRAPLPTLQLLLDRGAAAVTVCSHLGRPKTEEDRATYAIAPVAASAARARPGRRGSACSRTRASTRARRRTTPGYARELADGNDLYVNDAFGSAHRAHSSTEAVAHLAAGLRGAAAARGARPPRPAARRGRAPVRAHRRRRQGRRQARRARAPRRPRRPRADRRQDGRAAARRTTRSRSRSSSRSTSSPRREFAEDAEARVATVDEIPDGWLGLDIGPATREAFGAIIREARTIFWNGPMGVFEWSRVRRRHARDRRGRGRRRRATRSSVAATRSARSRSSAWPTASRGSRRAAERRSSCSRAGSFPASLRSRRSDDDRS